MPEFSSRGRVPLFWESWAMELLLSPLGLHFGPSTYVLAGLAALNASLLGSRRRPLPAALAALMAGSAACWATARLTLFHLYLPDRYLYAVPLVLAAYVASNGRRTSARLAAYLRVRGLRVRPGWLSASAVLAVALSNAGFYEVALARCHVPGVCAAAATLPREAVVAGWPTDMDWVPLLSRRAVLINYELSSQWHRGFGKAVDERTRALFEAYYATDVAPLHALRRRFGATHLVVGRHHLAEDVATAGRFYYGPHGFLAPGRFYYEPYESWLREWVPKQGRLYLADPPAEAVVWSDSTHFMVDLARLPPAGQAAR